MSTKYYPVDQIHQLAVKALISHKTSLENAHQIADALVAAEIDGLSGHGLSRLPSYTSQSSHGKVNGNATPSFSQVSDAAICVNARHGFAYPAMALAIEKLCDLTSKTGIAVAAVTNSHHCGAAGYHVEKLAENELIGILFANTPKAIAPWGGQKGLFGTNPIAFAAPRKNKPSLVIDLALSKVARGKIMVANREKRPIPEGWALDSAGRATTDAGAALSGTMVPMGDAKGAALVLMVEILAAALTSSNFGYEASSFFDVEGESPGVGQLLIAIAPNPLSGGNFYSRIESLCNEILSQQNTRLPGDRRLMLRKKASQDGIALSKEQYGQLITLADGPDNNQSV